MAVYDDETKNEEPYKPEPKSLTPKGLKAAEEGNGKQNSDGGTEAQKLSNLADQVGRGYREVLKNKGIGRLRISRRKGIAGGIIGVLVGGAITASILTGPTFVVNHLREIITNKISQVQVQESRKYRRSNLNKISDLFSKDGRLGGKMIGEMEARGYRFSYKKGTNQVIGLTLPDGSKSLTGVAIGDHIEDYMEVRHPLRSSRWKTQRTNALYRRYGISRTSIVSTLDDAIDNPDTVINKRIATNTLGEPADLEEAKAPPGETDDQKKAREANNHAINDGATTSGVTGEIRDDVLEGEDLGTSAQKRLADAGISTSKDLAESTVEQLGVGAGEGVLKTVEAIAKSKSIASRLGNFAKSLVTPTDVLDNVCTVKARLRMATTIARNHRALAMLKYSSTFIGVADATRTGKVNPKLMNSVMKRVMSEDRNGNTIGASPGFIYALKGKFNKATNNSSKGAYALDGNLTGTWKGIQDATDSIPGTSLRQCGVIQNVAFQVGSGIVVTVGKAVLCVFSVGAGCAAEEGLETGARVAVTTAIKESIQDTIRNVFTKRLVRDLAIGAVVQLSFEGILILTQMHIEKALALPVTGQEKGAELGSILTAGGGVANKQRSLQAGMVPATTDQFKQAEDEFVAWKKEDMSHQSFFARVLDWNNPDSFAFNMVTSLPLGSSGVASFARTNIASGLTNLLNGRLLTDSLANLFNGRAYADDEISYDNYTLEKGDYKGTQLAVDFAGSPEVILRSDIASIDPEENIRSLSASGDIDPVTLEIKSDRFKNHVANCVDNIDIISRLEFDNSTATPDKDCLAKNPLTVRFKAHLAYLDMVDGVEAEFAPGGL